MTLKRPALLAFALAGLTVYVVVFFLACMPAALARPALFGVAATIDLTITFPAFCWFILFRPGYAKWPAVLLTALAGVRAALLLLPVSEQVGSRMEESHPQVRNPTSTGSGQRQSENYAGVSARSKSAGPRWNGRF